MSVRLLKVVQAKGGLVCTQAHLWYNYSNQKSIPRNYVCIGQLYNSEFTPNANVQWAL